MRYFISQGITHHPIEVEIDGVPPCLFCGDPVTRPSMDGPLVCGSCDCGCNRDGSKWTDAQAEERYVHRRTKVAEYRARMIESGKLAEEKGMRMTKLDLDPATQKILDGFDAHAKKRFLELLGHRDSPLQATAEISFCLGYKAGVIDLGAAQREMAVVDVAHLAAVFAAACAWRDSAPADRRYLAGVSDLQETRLIEAIDAAMAARKEGSS